MTSQTVEYRKAVLDRFTINESSLTELGTAGPRTFYQTGKGEEYFATGYRSAELPEKSSTFMIRQVYANDDPKHQLPPEREEYVELAGPMPAGSFEQAKARADEAAAKAAVKTAPKLVTSGIEHLALVKPKQKPRRPGQSVEVRPRAETVDDYLDRLESRGVQLSLANDGDHVVVMAPGGSLDPEARALLDKAMPLIVAKLKGSPLKCLVACTKAATTLLYGGAPYCGTCTPKEK